MQPTPYEDVNCLLESLLFQMRHALRENLVGLYLYGSLVTGDFDPEISDLDLLAATTSDLSDEELQRLQIMHHTFARDNPKWDNRVEIAYLSTTALTTFKIRCSRIAIISPGEPFHAIEAGIDWLMNWYVVREQGVTLLGPPPVTLIASITKEEFIHSVREHARAWDAWIEDKQERKAQAYAILTMCRSLYAVQNGEQASKRRAALWAQQELPEWASLIQNALLWREAQEEGEVNHEATYPETVRFVKMVSSRMAK